VDDVEFGRDALHAHAGFPDAGQRRHELLLGGLVLGGWFSRCNHGGMARGDNEERNSAVWELRVAGRDQAVPKDPGSLQREMQSGFAEHPV
jgi:hypothetical protein